MDARRIFGRSQRGKVEAVAAARGWTFACPEDSSGMPGANCRGRRPAHWNAEETDLAQRTRRAQRAQRRPDRVGADAVSKGFAEERNEDKDEDWQTRKRIARRYETVKYYAGNWRNLGLDGRRGGMNGAGGSKRKKKKAKSKTAPLNPRGTRPLSKAEKWLDHLTSCSPCYRDFFQFQAARRGQGTRTSL